MFAVRECVQCRHFAEKGDSLDADDRSFCDKNKILENDVVRSGKSRGGIKQCGQGEGDQLFCDFVRASFMDGTLLKKYLQIEILIV